MEHKFWSMFESIRQFIILKQAALDELDAIVLGKVPLGGRGKVVKNDYFVRLEFEKSSDEITANETSSACNQDGLLFVGLG